MSREVFNAARHVVELFAKDTGNTGHREALRRALQTLEDQLAAEYASGAVIRPRGDDIERAKLSPGTKYKVFTPKSLGTLIGPSAANNNNLIFQSGTNDPIVFHPTIGERWSYDDGRIG